MSYDLVFDVRQAGFIRWNFGFWIQIISPLVFIFVASRLIRNKTKTISPVSMPIRIAMLALFVFISLLGIYSPSKDYLTLCNALTTGKCNVVEGYIINFYPMPFSGHAYESFEVNGIRFFYSDYAPQSGFNNTSSHGGPIRGGLKVKIYYLDLFQKREIARLEIARQR